MTQAREQDFHWLMPQTEGTYRAREVKFPYTAWLPEGSERGRVYLFPGMGSAPSEFAGLGEFLSSHDISLFATAVRGQGLDPNESRRGTELKVAEILQDLEGFLAATPTTVPRFLCGESMGAMLTIQALIRPKTAAYFQGGILFCPVVQLRKPTPGWQIQVLHFLAPFFPRLSLHPGWFVHGKASAPKLTADVAYQDHLVHAPFRLPRAGLGFLSGMADLIETSRTAGPALHPPILHLVGEFDPYISVEQSRRWFESVASLQKTLRVFSQSHHLLLHDSETPEVLREVHAWLETRLT